MSKTRFLLVLSVLAAVLLALAAAGCGGGDDDEGQPAATGNTTGEEINVGLVSDTGRFNDRSFNESALNGLERAESQLGVDGRPIESKIEADYVPNLSTLAQQGYELVIGVGFKFEQAMDTVATKFPKTSFAIIDFPQSALKHKPKNVQGLLFASQQAGYLVGYLAALQVKQQGGKQVISWVGGEKLPSVDSFAAGYEAGAKKANPQIKVLSGYSQDFNDQAKCKEIALTQIAQGSQAVFQIAGGCGLGALDAAKEKKVWGIGVDQDQAFLGDHILTSAVKRVDVSVFDTIQAVQKGNFKGGSDRIFSLTDNGVGLGKVSPRVSKDLVAKVEQVRKQIVAGKVEIPAELK